MKLTMDGVCTIQTATGGKIIVRNPFGEIVMGAGYSKVKQVLADGNEIWRNNRENKK